MLDVMLWQVSVLSNSNRWSQRRVEGGRVKKGKGEGDKMLCKLDMEGGGGGRELSGEVRREGR